MVKKNAILIQIGRPVFYMEIELLTMEVRWKYTVYSSVISV